SFTFDNTNAGQVIKLNAIPSGYYATGFEYQDTSSPPGCQGTDTVSDNGSGGWCLHDSLETDASESISLAGDSEVHFGIKPLPQTYSITGAIYVDSSPLQTKGTDPNYTGGTSDTRTIAAYYTDNTLAAKAVSGGGGYKFSDSGNNAL